MEADSSDILGRKTFPVVRGTQSGPWSGLSFGVKVAFVLAALLVLYVVGVRAWEIILVWREKSYKLAMRRRHGIPDNDHRPFNVAYAAVVRARQESEAALRRAKLDQILPGQDQRSALPEQNIRQRQGTQRAAQTLGSNAIPGRYGFSTESMMPATSASASNMDRAHSSAYSINIEDQYNPNPHIRFMEPDLPPSPAKAGPSRRASRKNINIIDAEGRKRVYEDDGFEEPDHVKKTRVEGEELIDGDEDAEWQERQDLPQRGSKRVLGDDDNDDMDQSKRTREKRARKVSLEKTPQYRTEDMDIDQDDDVQEHSSILRGKKRGRAEAGSTFGGDDEDSTHEAEEEDDAKARRHRKRRTYAKRKSDVASTSRGTKRDRDIDDGESELESEEGSTVKVSRKKRGKKYAQTFEHDDEDKRGSDMSMDESQASSTKGGRRRIGDEWESNGVKYKIGPNGQRLRQALVKKARQKFNMPKDSQHPDRQANLEVCIETWLTEEEYREAKDQLMLAWQDSNKPSAEPETPSAELQESPSPSTAAGKDLLWSSTSTAPNRGTATPRQTTPPGTPQPKPRDPFRQSIATNVGLRINPFQKQQGLAGKRIASAARVSSILNGSSVHAGGPASPALSDSTSGSPRGQKLFSKWEKQDLEAKAMMKMREANRKKEEERTQKAKEEQEKKEKEKKEREAAAAAAKTIPTITFTKPEENKPAQAESKPPSISFGPPPTATSTAPPKFPTTSMFGPSAGTPFGVTSTAQPKAEDKASKPPMFPGQSQPSSTTAFPSSSAPLGGLPAKPATSPFGPSQPQQAKPPSSFSFAAPSNPPAAPPTSKAPFSFGPPPVQPSKADEKKAGEAGGASLLSRLAPPATQAVPQQPAQSTGFSFAKPAAAEAPKPASFFNTAPQSALQPPTASAAPKFSFGLSKPTGTTPSAAPAPSSSSLSGALGASDAMATSPSPPKAPSVESATIATSGGTTAPKFSFGTPASTFAAPASNSPFAPTTLGGKPSAPTAPSTDAGAKSAFFKPASPMSTSASMANAGATTTPKFSFGAPASGSAFGSTTSLGANSVSRPAAAPAPDTSAKSAFSFGTGGASSSSSTTSAFGTTTSSSSPFGSGSAFGGSTASNVFSTAPKTGEASKPATFGFGTSSSTTATTPAGEGTKPMFSFANQTTTSSSTPSASATSAPTTSAFGFGDASRTSTTPQASSAPGQSPFGAKPATGPGAFGFGAAGNSTGAFSAFGKAPTSTGQQQQ